MDEVLAAAASSEESQASSSIIEKNERSEFLLSNRIIFSSHVQGAIEQVLQSTDPLDAADFNSIDYINQLFPNEQSLSNIDEVITKMECQITLIDDNIRSVVRGKTNNSQDGRKALEEAQSTIKKLFIQISDIKSRAESTEESVKEITRDIKQLDCGKKNLTTAITTLNHLHMLVGGVESLNKLIEKRLYGEILNPLQAITEVNQHFRQYNDIQQIKDLSNSVATIQNVLAKQITVDFHNFFSPVPLSPTAVKTPLTQLADACKVVSVLDLRVRGDLLKWFLGIQLEEYIQLFQENQDIAWLDRIDKRYAWLKRHLLDFEDKFGKIFPLDWEVSERITVEFCRITQSELTAIMQKRRTEIDVKLLLFAITKTQSFEQLLAKRFTGSTLNEIKTQQESTSITESSIVETIAFNDLIGKCFKQHLDIYTESVDRNLSELIDRFIEQSKKPFDPIESKTNIFPSCADLFVFYKKCMVQCAQLSNKKPMLDLAMIFKKYLREYSHKILQSNVPVGKCASGQTATANTTGVALGTSMALLTRRDLQNFSTAAGQVIHNFLKEGETPRYSKDDIIRICCVLTTSEYCLETVQQLEDKLKEKVHAKFVEHIDLSDEQDIFHRIISNCIQLLVQDVENGCESALSQMHKTQWHNILNVGDQSAFVTQISHYFKQTIPIIRENLSTSRKYYTQFCLKFINSFIPKYQTTLYKCKLVNTDSGASSNVLGCEQLLLDTYSIKTILLDLPSIQSQVNRKAPTSYTKVVKSGMARIEIIIKVVMTPVHPAKIFLDQVLKLIPDIIISEYQKILDMKSLKRSDQTHMIELFKNYALPAIQENKSDFFNDELNNDDDAAAAATNNKIIEIIEKNFSKPKQNQNLDLFTTSTIDSERGRIKKLENLIKKRLP